VTATTDALRTGTLGDVRITRIALVQPARDNLRATVTAVAARDRERARKFADKRGIPRVLESSDALVADPEIDAVYNPLPNGLRGEWTLKALAAGKHVLCEKPFTANAAEASVSGAENSIRVLTSRSCLARRVGSAGTVALAHPPAIGDDEKASARAQESDNSVGMHGVRQLDVGRVRWRRLLTRTRPCVAVVGNRADSRVLEANAECSVPDAALPA